MSCRQGITKDGKCTKCGADLNKRSNVENIAFLDGNGWGEKHGQCKKCGNQIMVRTTWSKERFY